MNIQISLCLTLRLVGTSARFGSLSFGTTQVRTLANSILFISSILPYSVRVRSLIMSIRCPIRAPVYGGGKCRTRKVKLATLKQPTHNVNRLNSSRFKNGVRGVNAISHNEINYDVDSKRCQQTTK